VPPNKATPIISKSVFQDSNDTERTLKRRLDVLVFVVCALLFAGCTVVVVFLIRKLSRKRN
jgi:hypothetical protein